MCPECTVRLETAVILLSGSFPQGQVFPPCEYCREKGNRKDITWVLVVETQAK